MIREENLLQKAVEFLKMAFPHLWGVFFPYWTGRFYSERVNMEIFRS